MYRRTPSVLAVVILLLVSGCPSAAVVTEANPEPDTPMADGATKLPQPNERTPDPRDPPAAPGTITAETVGPFAASSEEIRMHNELVGANSNLVSLGTACTVDSVEPDDGSYAVVVECGHWYEFEDGENRGIADGAPYSIVYTVSEDGRVSPGGREPAF